VGFCCHPRTPFSEGEALSPRRSVRQSGRVLERKPLGFAPPYDGSAHLAAPTDLDEVPSPLVSDPVVLAPLVAPVVSPVVVPLDASVVPVVVPVVVDLVVVPAVELIAATSNQSPEPQGSGTSRA
jgi:hypothetical protein